MKTIATVTALLLASAVPAAAQNCTTSFVGNTAYTNCYGSGNAFQDGYNAATNNGTLGPALAQQMAQQRNTEAVVNEMRRQHGVGPCAIAPLKQLVTGRPAC